MKTIRAVFKHGEQHVKTQELFQFDIGIMLSIAGLDSSDIARACFYVENPNVLIEANVQINNNVIYCAIPDVLLRQGDDLGCSIYYNNGVYGRTVFTVHIPVINRVEAIE